MVITLTFSRDFASHLFYDVYRYHPLPPTPHPPPCLLFVFVCVLLFLLALHVHQMHSVAQNTVEFDH